MAADGQTLGELTRIHEDGFYEGVVDLSANSAYRLQVLWHGGQQDTIDDPYRFPLVLGEMDVWLLGEGTHLRPFEVLGAQVSTMLGGCRYPLCRLGTQCVTSQRRG
jgi:1,4-alpha-glucan branching enzyme